MRILLFAVLLLASGCNTMPSLEQVAATGEVSGVSAVSSYPIEASKYVSMHADRTLRLNRSCSQVLKLQLVQSKSYQDTMIELKNRAVIMGGNAVSLVQWQEKSSVTGLLGNIYICTDKSYHIHPHPQA